MELSYSSIEAYKKLLTNPTNYGFEFKPIQECFEKVEEVTPKHILYEQYMEYLKKPLPKVVFYIVMDELFGDRIGKTGDKGIYKCYLGYKLKLNV